MRCKLLLIGSVLISTLLLSSETSAQAEWLKWAPENGAAIRQGNAIGWNQAVASREDGDQSTAVIWEDTRNGCRTIAMQILESDGTPRFEGFGKLLLDPTGSRTSPSVCPAPGNAWFVIWIDESTNYQFSVRCAKVASDGNLVWENDGAVALTGNGAFYSPKVFSDGGEGCIALWKETTQPYSNIVAVHVLSDGTIDNDWHEGRLLVAPGNYLVGSPHAIPDGDGGVFLAWQQFAGFNQPYEVQHITADGNLAWNDGNPVEVCESEDQSDHFDLALDGEGGIFFVWTDYRNYRQNYRDVFVQRIDSEGSVVWQAGGEPLAASGDYEQNPRVVNSGAGEAIVVWEYLMEGGYNIDINAMKIGGDEQMNFLWDDEDGVNVVRSEGIQWNPSVCGDGNGGAMVVWTDCRNEVLGNESDIYMQRLSDDGETLFGETGLPLFRRNLALKHPIVLASPDGFIAVWWKGLGEQCIGLMSQKIDNQGDLLGDPVDILFARSGSVYQYQLIAIDEDEFAIGWLDSWFPSYSPVLLIRTLQDGGGNLANLNEDGTIISPPEGYFIGSFKLVPAGNGEIVVLYTIIDDENVHLMARKMNSDGSFAWNNETFEIASHGSDISNITAVSDENGGAFIAWTSSIPPEYYQHPYCQYVSSEGERLWGDEGIMLGQEEVECLDATIVADGEGGAAVLWREVEFNGVYSTTVLVMNRISSDGQKLWGEDGSFFMPGIYCCYDMKLLKHPLGFFAAWTHSYLHDDYNEFFDIRAQMISAEGVELWDEEGVALCSGDDYRGGVDAAIDSDGNIWVSWHDLRSEQGPHPAQIYCQNIDPTTVVSGEPSIILSQSVTEETSGQYENKLIPDNQGGMWFVWSEYDEAGFRDLRTMHIDANGERYEGWGANGMDVCAEVFSQETPQCIPLRNTENGIVAVWLDYRSSVNNEGGLISNLYSQRIDDGHGLSVKSSAQEIPAGFEITGLYPNPFNSMATLEYRLGNLSPVGVQVFDMNGRQVFGQEPISRSPGTHTMALNAEGWASGEYIAKLQAGNEEVSKRIILVK